MGTIIGKLDMGLMPVSYDGPLDPIEFKLTGMGEVPDPNLGGAIQDALNRPKASPTLTDHNIGVPSAWQWPFPFEWYPWEKDKKEEAPIDEPIPIPPAIIQDPTTQTTPLLIMGAFVLAAYFLVRRFV